MRTTIKLFAVLVLCSIAIYAQDMSGHHHAAPIADTTETEITQDWAKQRLTKSSRRQEWVKVKNDTREVNSLVVYPEAKTKATAAAAIHENGGLTDWVQSLADQLAEAG